MSTAQASDIASRIRGLREQRNFTQAELGSRAGMSAASVSHFETGQRVPSVDSLVKLADALEVSVDMLLGRAAAEAHVDPLFLRASRASGRTLDTIKRVTAALLAESETKPVKSQHEDKP